MTSERIQRRIERLLDQAEAAADERRWDDVQALAHEVLSLDESNADAGALLRSAGRMLDTESPDTSSTPSDSSIASASVQPTSFADGRYEVKRFLGEGGKKKVYLAHDARLDRDVAFALIKTEGLDEAARERITREAQAMGRLGNHPNIVTVYDIGEEEGQPFMVLPVLAGGDVEGLIEKADEHKLPIERAVEIAADTCKGLEHAHMRGIVHRDLKPGNVWLTEDGRAMIGDFGLAVAVDRSRLTQAGMMVGTVSYMPPEQAMGSEVTPRSDLYSLGAMLYEMVCGRPPFVGDESVAIIGQHLNTPPVAPTWHRPDCPPVLETLILRLLEKDPERRPVSANEVREALGAVGQAVAREGTQTQEPVPAPHVHDPLYRTVFVGREAELRQLQQAYDAAVSGQGGLVMVVGEPGIGKTALCEQLATYISIRGGRTLVGHCYEEGSLSLPYLAFVEAMRTYVLARDPDGLKSDLGSGAADVARIVSEVRDRVDVTLRDASDPEDDRWRLLQSVTTFLRNAASVQPLVIVLEDLHWADRGTLDLLQHVARNLGGARLLVIGTYRDVEVDRTHPLSGTLAELRRSGEFFRVPLRGLTVEEVQRMYQIVRGSDTISWARAEAVHRQTEGNPLFVQEILRYMVEEGYVSREGGRWVLAEGTGPTSGIPEGLRDVVGKRLSRLSDKTNQVLSVAAVMGREFRLDVLQQVAGVSEDEVIDALEEASERAVVEVRPGLAANLSYRFTHAFFRQTLYEELSPPRRIRIHQQVARALERVYERRVQDHAAELAEHYSYSSDPADLTKAIAYGELAASRAMSVYAYEEAVHHLERAIEVQEVLQPDDGLRRCDLLLALGNALTPTTEQKRVVDQIAPEAYELAMAAGDKRRAFRVCALVARFFAGTGLSESMTFEQAAEWANRSFEVAEPDTREEALARFYLAVRLRSSDPVQAWPHLKRAYELGMQLEDDEVLSRTFSWVRQGVLTPAQDYADFLNSNDPFAGRELKDLLHVSSAPGLVGLGESYLQMGDRAKAETQLDQLKESARVTRQPEFDAFAVQFEAQLLTVDGRFDEIFTRAAEYEEREKEANRLPRLPIGRMVRRALMYMGRDEEALGTLPPPGDFLSGGVWEGQRAIILPRLGRRDEAVAILNRFLALPEVADPNGPAAVVLLRYLLEAGCATQHLETCQAVFKRMALFHSMVMTEGVLSCIPRSLAEACLLFGNHDEARRFFEQAVEVCARIRFRPEVALARLGLAELLLDHYPDERDAAIEHLDFAIAELRDMKMQPALERALGRRGLLKA